MQESRVPAQEGLALLKQLVLWSTDTIDPWIKELQLKCLIHTYRWGMVSR